MPVRISLLQVNMCLYYMLVHRSYLQWLLDISLICSRLGYRDNSRGLFVMNCSPIETQKTKKQAQISVDKRLFSVSS